MSAAPVLSIVTVDDPEPARKVVPTFRQVPDVVADLGDPYCTHVYHSLLRIARNQPSITASRKYISTISKVSERKVADTLGKLASAGFLSIEHRHDERGFSSNRITFKTPKKKADTPVHAVPDLMHAVPGGTAPRAGGYGTTCTTNRYVPTDTLVDTTTPIPPTPSDNTEDKDVTLEERFDVFWKAYPKKRAKGDARKAFKAAKVNDELLIRILAAIDVQRSSEQWTKAGGQFIPYPATWIRAEGWEDVIEVEVDAAPAKQLPRNDPDSKRLVF